MDQNQPHNEQKVAEFIALPNSQDRLPLICQWTSRFYQAGKMVAIHLSDEETAGRLDELMWTFSDTSFLPHGIACKATEPVLEPILIYYADQTVDPADVLFEGGSGAPRPNFEEFQFIFDFAAIYDDDLRAQGRKRYSAYQEADYQMRYVDHD